MNPSRDNRISRRSWLLAGLATPLSSTRAADPLGIRYDGDTLRLAPSGIHFLAGKPLERLKDGASVAYVIQLDLFNEQRISVRQQHGRFVVSHDLWEETFSVTQLGRTSRSADGMSAPAAETWCFDALSLSTLGLSTSQLFWLRFEMRTGGPSDLEGDLPNGISLKSIIDLLGRKRQVDAHWGPMETRLRLADLPRVAGRGARA
jgi:hypothetical protein